MFNQLQSCNENDDEIDAEANYGGISCGLEQTNATGLLPDEENAHVEETHPCINHLHQHETAEIDAINASNAKLGTAENPLPFPTTTNRINECSCLSPQSMASLILFPYSASDTTSRDRASSVSLTESNQHLLKHCFLNQNNDFVHPHAKYDHQIHQA